MKFQMVKSIMYKLVHIGNTTYVNFVNTFVGCLVE